MMRWQREPQPESAMNPEEFFAIAYRDHQFSNPISPELVDRILLVADLQPGYRAADLGCGPGGMAIHVAVEYGLRVDAVDMSAPVLEEAQRRLSTASPGGSVRLHHQSIEDFIAGAPGPYELVMVVGATQFVTAAGSRTQLFSRLRPMLAAGGRILYGDVFWRTEPIPEVASVLAPYERFPAHVRAAEEASLRVEIALESSQLDWDEFVWKAVRSIEEHALGIAARDAAGAEALRSRARAMRDMYLNVGREALGFGLFLMVAD